MLACGLGLTLIAANRGDAARKPASEQGASLFGLVLQSDFSLPLDGPAIQQANPATVRILVAQSLVGPHGGTCTAAGDACNWATIDQEVGAAAAAGAQILPFMFGESSKPPATGRAATSWKQFLTAAVQRYGPNGLYWEPGGEFETTPWFAGASPSPIETWQIWNEPGSPSFFKPKPNVGTYVKLLKLSGRAIHTADPTAKIMMAGLFSSTDKGAIKGRIPAVQFLQKLYAIKGAKAAFDIAALHPYARSVTDVVKQVGMIRNVMRKHHDGGTQLAITELGWSSNKPNGSLLAKGLTGQANTLNAVFRKLVAAQGRYKLNTVDWYALRDTEKGVGTCNNCPYAGLLKVDGSPKPAWSRYLSFTE